MPVGSPWPMNQHPDTARAEIAEARVVAVERDRDEIAIRCADDVASAEARVAELEAALDEIDWVARQHPDSGLAMAVRQRIQGAQKGQHADS